MPTTAPSFALLPSTKPLYPAIPSGTEGLGTSNPPTPSGWPGTTAEMSIARFSTFIAHLTSLITGGVFADFPNLIFVGF